MNSFDIMNLLIWFSNQFAVYIFATSVRQFFHKSFKTEIIMALIMVTKHKECI